MPLNDEYIRMKTNREQKQQDTAAQNKNEWDKMLSQARMAMEMDGQTALGLALGKLIRGAWDHHQEAQRRKKNEAISSADLAQYGNGTMPPMQTSTQAVTQTAVQTPEGVARQETSYIPWEDVINSATANGDAYRAQAMKNASSPEAVSNFFQTGTGLNQDELRNVLGLLTGR